MAEERKIAREKYGSVEESEKYNISSQKKMCTIALFVLAVYVLNFTIHILLHTLSCRAHHHHQCAKWFKYSTTENCCLMFSVDSCCSFMVILLFFSLSIFSILLFCQLLFFLLLLSVCLSGCCIAIATALCAILLVHYMKHIRFIMSVNDAAS